MESYLRLYRNKEASGLKNSLKLVITNLSTIDVDAYPVHNRCSELTDSLHQVPAFWALFEYFFSHILSHLLSLWGLCFFTLGNTGCEIAWNKSLD